MELKVCSVGERVRSLTTHEIDRRISRLVAEVAEHEDGLVAVAGGCESDALRPRWISAAELVRRMRPFIVLN